MGADVPFLYENPAKFSFTGPTESGFNPRAATQASWSPPKPKPKQEGPLINSKEFDRHPDSYFVVPYGNLNWKPMSPRTKAKVTYTRWAQLSLRIMALLGAVGMLVCVICITKTQGTEGWTIRVPPAVAILHTIYAVYHLVRSSTARTAASSASYMIFAVIIDACLIPFFVFTAMLSRNQYTRAVNVQTHWQTLFGADDATHKIIFSTFLISIVNGGLHLVSLVMSIYLAIIFRKISKLPPDMNPLEDNLTSRHKRNKSSITNNRMSQSTTTTNTMARNSKAEDPLIAPPRTVPFLHTRNDSFENIPHPRASPRVSRADPPSPYYDQPSSKRNSHVNVHHSLPPTRASSIYSDNTRPTSTRPQSIQPSNRRQSIAPTVPDETENWTTHPSPPPTPFELKHLRTPYQPVPQNLPLEGENFVPRPLEMNPPTPPNHYNRNQDPRQRVLVPGTGNTIGTAASERQRGYEGLGSGKMRGGGRVVSRTGVEMEITDKNAKGMRVREVSGKVAEEGRGDKMWRERGRGMF